MPRPLVRRPWFVLVWGAVTLALNVYTSVYYYQYLKLFVPLLSGGQLSPPWWLADERVFMLVWCATAVALILSFSLYALTSLHAWRYAKLSQTGKIIWTLVPLFLWQPGFLAYWVWNVARPLVIDRRLEAKRRDGAV